MQRRVSLHAKTKDSGERSHRQIRKRTSLGRHEWFGFSTGAKWRFFTTQGVRALVYFDNAVVVIDGTHALRGADSRLALFPDIWLRKGRRIPT
jgi:hypothetical protein